MSTFELFRYQLLPASQHQHELFTSILSADQVRERKNEFFDTALKKLPKFRHRGLEIELGVKKLEAYDPQVLRVCKGAA